MKRPIFTLILCLITGLAATPRVFAQQPIEPKQSTATDANPAASRKSGSTKTAPVKTSKYTLDIRELTNSQAYRFGREMFLRGNNAEAAKVFLEIIRLDCHNKLAHYHLQKIAERDPAYAFLNKTLKSLPCGTYNFDKDDFLPASVYYEKDTDILVAQLASYHKRQRLTEKEMQAQADKFNALVNELEATISGLIRQEDNGAAIEDGPATLTRIETARKIANKFDKQIAYLKSQLTSERLERQQEIQNMRTQLAAAEANLAETDSPPQTPSLTPDSNPAAQPETASGTTSSTKNYSADAQALLTAVEQAKSELHNKEILLTQKDTELTSLQDRFDDILRRLKIIQDDLDNKNSQIRAIENNLQDIQQP